MCYFTKKIYNKGLFIVKLCKKNIKRIVLRVVNVSIKKIRVVKYPGPIIEGCKEECVKKK